MTKKDTEIPERKKSAKYYDNEGDLDIISSDDVHFKISAYYLQGAS
jgi:hypothetical protein